MHPDLVVGGTFPDLELPEAQFGPNPPRRRLSEIQGPDPMAVVFYRGNY
ncbi:MAG: hypothetical protein HY331_15020 [Chloroflexi bacterium]|nr:hypothetical protein [Chloroflexota bacterium]